MDSAIMAHHHGEIHCAVDELTPQQRKYVKARFWLDMNTTELRSEVFGYDPSSLWNSCRNGAKGKLANKLAHLQLTRWLKGLVIMDDDDVDDAVAIAFYEIVIFNFSTERQQELAALASQMDLNPQAGGIE